MDLNQLLHRHQVSLMRADDATSPEERRAHEQFALDLAATVHSTRKDRDPPEAQNTSNFLTQVLAAFLENRRTRLPAMLIRANGSEEPVVITEVSEGGFRVSLRMTPSVDEHVYIRSEGHDDVAAQIRWAHGTEAGGSF